MERAFRAHFRPPEGAFRIERVAGAATARGWFCFDGAVGFGSLVGAQPAPDLTGPVPDVTDLAEIGAGVVRLPFDLDEVAQALRHEEYVDAIGAGRSGWRQWARRPYYAVRPLLPVAVRKHLQRAYVGDWEDIAFPAWPVDTSLDRLLWSVMALVLDAVGGELPMVWFWPDGARGCVLLTHDVETSVGRDRCLELAELDRSFGARPSFQLVPEDRYEVPPQLVDDLRRLGCDVNVHGLNHDGHLFDDRRTFTARAGRIRDHAERLQAEGFRSPVLYRRAGWIPELGFAYDMSIPNVGHLDPQRGGCCTVLPFWVGDTVELPLTTAQDYTVLHVLARPDLALWRQQLDIISAASGLACFNVHPDYLEHAGATALYRELLALIADRAAHGPLWRPSPDEAAAWWRKRHATGLRCDGDRWEVDQPGHGAVVGEVRRTSEGVRVCVGGEDRSPIPPADDARRYGVSRTGAQA